LIDNIRICVLKLELGILTVFKDERILRSHGIVRFSGVALDIHEIFDDVRLFLAETNHEKDRTHKSDLMPKEGISNIVEIVDRVTVISFLQLFITIHFYDIC
jgi:hypothetical protein